MNEHAYRNELDRVSYTPEGREALVTALMHREGAAQKGRRAWRRRGAAAAVGGGLPHLEMVGSRHLYLEHRAGILSYGEEQIDVNTSGGVLRVRGQRLSLMAMTAEELRIGGDIAAVEWV